MKKRFLAILLAMVMVLALIPTSAFAADTSGFEIENGKLVKYTGADTDVVIPEGVLIIGSEVFKDLPLTSVTFPSTLLQIEARAFQGCKELTNVALPKGVLLIGREAFEGCVSLTSAVFSEGFKETGYRSFANCINLKNVTFPSSLTQIIDSTFGDDISLTDIYYAGPQAKWQNVSIQYNGNSRLSDVTVHYNATIQEVPASKDVSTQASAPTPTPSSPSDFTVDDGKLTSYTGSGTDVVIPEGVRFIGAGVFKTLPLTSVTFPSTLLEIESYAFQECRYLTSIALPEGTLSMGREAFQGCVSLTNVVISEGFKETGYRSFADCISLKSVTFPSSLTQITDSTFGDDISLTDIYYAGPQAKWKNISIQYNGNSRLNSVTVHYSSTIPEVPTTKDNSGLTPDPDNPGADPNPGTNPNPGTTTPSDVHFTRANVYHQGQFTDVPANQWYTQSVADAFELGLMKGNSATTFGVNGNVTVAEAITMACRIHAIYTTGSDSAITAQTGGQWYQPYLDYARQNKIISDAYYNSDVTQKATRAQFAEIFANSLPAEALSPINNIADGKIPDVPMTANYASAVYKLYRAGILAGGDATGAFSPSSFISRVEAAAIVSRMAESNSRRTFSL